MLLQARVPTEQQNARIVVIRYLNTVRRKYLKKYPLCITLDNGTVLIARAAAAAAAESDEVELVCDEEVALSAQSRQAMIALIEDVVNDFSSSGSAEAKAEHGAPPPAANKHLEVHFVPDSNDCQHPLTEGFDPFTGKARVGCLVPTEAVVRRAPPAPASKIRPSRTCGRRRPRTRPSCAEFAPRFLRSGSGRMRPSP